MDAVTLHHGDALDVLRGMADNSVDAVVTDPPSGIGFMGKTWDHDHGGREGWVKAFAAIFAECLRVVKPGGHALVWALPRTSHWTACALEDAGWEIRDCVAHLFGSGFPKSLDVGKAIDKAAGAEREVMGEYEVTRDISGGSWSDLHGKPNHARTLPLTAPATDAARQWDGWGTALKPAIEFWWLARKPLAGTVAANVQQWGTGGLNIEACRVGTETTQTNGWRTGGEQVYGGGKGITSPDFRGNVNAGRWPPNVVLSHSEQCRRVGTRRVRGGNGVRGSDAGNTMYGGGKGMNRPTTGQTVGYADADGLETVDDWRCVDGCAVRALAEQSGERPSGAVTRSETATAAAGAHGIYGTFAGKPDGAHFPASTGTAARFFPNFEASPLDTLDAPWLYTAKASRREREAGLEGIERKQKVYNGKSDRPAGCADGSVEDKFTTQPARNHHPTVKPLALMRWLVRLVTPPGGVVLDCFLGSGTTGMAAVLEGFRFIGVEQDAEYIEIARRRIAWAQEQEPPLLRATGD